ncbi:unnamed protein product [Gongylonema pulchrum]|uniref:UDENN domain-containing protein n=1 Tax=Gongylonema pulchrum TaxID=637853 RepID=A0A183EMJ9_9BILA|nr:unnamed protein product [Gongylonema pulchrum]
MFGLPSYFTDTRRGRRVMFYEFPGDGSSVYKYCTCVAYSGDTVIRGGAGGGNARNRQSRAPRVNNQNAVGAEFVGLDLYNHLKHFFQNYVENVFQVCLFFSFYCWLFLGNWCGALNVWFFFP